MPNIRPVSDLRYNFAGEDKQVESEIYNKLLEAETEARLSDKRLSHEEVFPALRRRIKDRSGDV
ncbi:hypothetical protein AGMMS49942_04000 [Spirochaetia bacterium]|nr:hypothetical protein AGMMS49942_04000 [Spirochaetia bacterium]